MRFRRAYLWLCLPASLLLAGGLLLPAHLRALDAAVVQSAGRQGPTLLQDGQTLVAAEKLGAAQLLLQAAELEKIPGREGLGVMLTNLTRQDPRMLFWGGDLPMETLFESNFLPTDQNLPLAAFLIRRENREAALARLRDSPRAAVAELLQSRSLKQTEIFSPSSSGAGQAFDTAVCLAGLLIEGGHLTAGLSGETLNLAATSRRGGGSLPLEQELMDFMSLGERLNWDQLTAFTAQIPNATALHRLAAAARRAGGQLPVLFAAVQLSGRPAAVGAYLERFPDTGLADLGASLRYGANGVSELAQRQERFYDPALERRVTACAPVGVFSGWGAVLALQTPVLALETKWLLYLFAGFCLAATLRRADPVTVSPPVLGLRWLRNGLFALGFLLVVLCLTEPFLSPKNPPGATALRLFPSALAAAVPAVATPIHQTIMNPIILLPLLVFLVLQALLYLACLVKLAEILRQRLPPQMKLKLLENEDHLFDAGLYLGFVGTIASLIIASQGLVEFSLMAAYSSTCFGIIFVVIFKIFHLRPARRSLLLEVEAQRIATEAATPETPVPAAAPAAIVPS